MRGVARMRRICAAIFCAVAGLSSSALGQGVPALCGDVSQDGVLGATDTQLIRGFLAQTPAGVLSFAAQERCNTIGQPGPCDIVDVTVLRRRLAGLGPGVQPTCPAFSEPDPTTVTVEHLNGLGGRPTDTGGVVGAVDASFDVNASGAAVYTIPIKVPPGTQGVEPKIALAYNSQGGYGLAGVGFELSGFSKIERCPSTQVQDGFVGTVTFSEQDRFCIDGMRLVKIGGGGAGYGAAGSRYYTEGQTWTRVEAGPRCDGSVTGADGGPILAGGPCTFTATLKNGTVVEYGDQETASCSILPGEGLVRSYWPITKTTDPRGNTIRYTHQAEGENRCIPFRIEYTGNDRLGALPQREVRFLYDPGATPVTTFTGGVAQRYFRKVSGIQTYIRSAALPGGEQLVRDYQIDYELAPDTQRSRISEIRECDGTGVCLPPTVLEWQEGNWLGHGDFYDPAPPGFVTPDPRFATSVGDLDGDAEPDFLEVVDPDPSSTLDDEYFNLYLTKGAPHQWYIQNWIPYFVELTAPDFTNHIHSVNVTGRSATQLLEIRREVGQPVEWRLYEWAEGGGLPLTPLATGTFPNADYPKATLGDFTGDGRTDVLIEGEVHVWDGTTYLAMGDWISDGDDSTKFYPADFNGDGKVDVLRTTALAIEPAVHGRSVTGWQLHLSTGIDFVLSSSGVWPLEYPAVLTGDFNGDGLSDLILHRKNALPGDSQGYVLVRSTGTVLLPNFHSTIQYTVHLLGESPYVMTWGDTGSGIATWIERTDELQTADWNADGMTDVLRATTLEDPEDPDERILSEIQVWISVGDRVVPAPDGKTIGVENDSFLAADIYGTGHTGVLMIREGIFNGPLFYYANAQEHPDMLVGITNGENAGIEVVYHPMSADFLYTTGISAVYPDRDWIDTRYLTYSTQLDDGNLANLDTFYEYEGALTNLEGLGFLGFKRIRSRTQEKILETEYVQAVPYSGAVQSQKEWYQLPAGDHLLSWTTYSYDDISTTPGVFEVVQRFERKRTGFPIGGPYSFLDANYEAQREWQYGAFGTVVRLIDEGDTSDPTYTVVTETDYANDSVAWRLGYPTLVETLDASSNLLARKTISYDAYANPTFQGDWDAGHAVYLGNTVVHNEWGNPTKSSDPLGRDTLFEYDAYGFLARVTNPLGHELQRVSDARFGVEIERWDVNGNNVEIKVDGFGRTTEIDGRDPSGSMVPLRLFALTSVGYGHVKQTFVRRNWGPSEWDWKEEFHDGLGRVYRTRKRGEGSDAIRTDLEFATTRDRLVRESKPYFESEQPIWTGYAYDFRGRVSRLELPGGQVIEIDVDESNRTVTRREPDFAETHLQLDPRGKLLSRIDPEGGVHYFSHDPLGRLWRVSDAAGVVTETSFDTLGRRTAVSDRDTGLTTFEFDASGHMVAEVDAKLQRIERSYDELDRTTEKRFFPPAGAMPTRRVEFEYDDPMLTNSVGQLSRVLTYIGATTSVLESRYTFAYDDYGRQAAVVLFQDTFTFTWAKEYDAAGQAQRFVYPDGSILRTTYTAAGSLSRLQLHEPTDPPNAYTTYARYTHFDAEGRPGLLLQSNGTATCWRYHEQRGTLLETATSHFGGAWVDPCHSGAPVASETRLIKYGYGYDGVNRVDAIDDLLDPARSQSFGYNGRGELTYANGLYGQHFYDYAPNGNMIYRDGETLDYDGTQLVQAGFQFMSYDANGNLASKVGSGPTHTYTWDTEDRLTIVDVGGQFTAYRYDFDGKRIRKLEPTGRRTYYAGDLYEVTQHGGNTLHTKYVPGPTGPLAQISRTGVVLVSLPVSHRAQARMYDRTHPLGWLESERHEWLARTSGPEFHRNLVLGSGLCAAAALFALLLVASVRPVLRRSLRFAPAGVALATAFAFFLTFGLGPGAANAALVPGANGVGVPVAGVFHQHPNHIGSTTVLSDASGSQVSRVEYDPWGAVYQPGSSGPDIFRAKFTGQEYDDGAGLYYMDSRYYDPALQRFISADASLGGDPLRGVSMHRYAYAGNSPITYIDPGGQAFWVALLIFGAALAVTGGLIAGTEGKILTDPANAFDNWSWTRFLFGAFIGVFTAVASFTLSFAFSGLVIAGVEIGQVVSQALVHALIDTSFALASGEADIGRFFAYFGIGMVGGFLNGAAPAVGAALGEVGGKLATETASTLLTSSLKRAVDGKHAFTVRVWAFSLSFRKDGSVEFGADYMYLASQAVSAASNFAATKRGEGNPDDPWGFDSASSRAGSPESSTLGWVNQHVSVENISGQAAANLYDVLQTVARGVTVYAVREVVTATGAGQHVLDAANFAVDQGFDGAFKSVVEPEGFADLAKGKLD